MSKDSTTIEGLRAGAAAALLTLTDILASRRIGLEHLGEQRRVFTRLEDTPHGSAKARRETTGPADERFLSLVSKPLVSLDLARQARHAARNEDRNS
jgi:hypothetical protein